MGLLLKQGHWLTEASLAKDHENGKHDIQKDIEVIGPVHPEEKAERIYWGLLLHPGRIQGRQRKVFLAGQNSLRAGVNRHKSECRKIQY